MENNGIVITVRVISKGELKQTEMINFKININNTEIDSNEITKYIKSCQSKKAISYIMEMSGCDLSEATEVVNEIKKTIHDQSIRGAGIRHEHNNEFKRCPKCGKEYIVSMDHCIQCGYKIESYIKRMNDLKNTIDIKEHSIKHTPHCPTCNSTNIRKIGTGERAASIIGLGLFSRKINKTWKCNDCGHTW
nr:MAG: Transcription factor S-II (TFIIS) [Bacteriophage sp.]